MRSAARVGGVTVLAILVCAFLVSVPSASLGGPARSVPPLPRAPEGSDGPHVAPPRSLAAFSPKNLCGSATSEAGCRPAVSPTPPLASPAWVERTIEVSHLPLFWANLVYDTQLTEAVEFEGAWGATWAYSNGGWTNITPVQSPSIRAFSAMAYDSTSQDILLFGGTSLLFGTGPEFENDTWLFSNGVWTNVTTPGGPSARFGAVMVNDPSAGGVMMFGGVAQNGSGGNLSNQTWVYVVGSGWSVVSTPTAPPASAFGAIAYDTIDHRAVLYGGDVLVPGTTNATPENQTWTFNSTGWTNHTVVGPPAMALGSLADDPSVGGVVLFGGTQNVTSNTSFRQTWVWHANTWAALATVGPVPLARHQAAFAWDYSTGSAILDGGIAATGGFDNDGWLVDTWTYRAGGWSEVQANFTPDARLFEGFAQVGSAPNGATLFGGLNGSLTARNDTWTFAHGAWQERIVPGSPPPLYGPMFAADPADNYQLLFGGQLDSGKMTNATWSFTAAGWTNRSSGAAPSPRVAGVLAFDPALGVDVLFGGLAPGNITLNDTWTYAAGIWTRLPLHHAPPAREFAAAAYDPTLDGLVVFGGTRDLATGTGGVLNDTWVFAHGTWSNITSEAAPPVRYGASMDFDQRLGAPVLFGGWNVPNSPQEYNDTWVLTNSTWVPLETHHAPPIIGFTGQWWDPAENLTWLYGGAQYLPGTTILAVLADTDALDLLRASTNVSGLTGTAPEDLTFSANASDGAGPYQYAWTFEGTRISTPAGSIALTTSTRGTLYLNVTDAFGVTWGTTFSVSVTAAPLRASFTATPATGAAPLTVTFRATATGGTDPYAYAWNFGDGPTLPSTAQPNATHTYTSNRTFSVELIVTDATSGTAAAFDNLTFAAVPPSPFQVTASVSPSGGVAPLSIAYTAATHNGTAPFTFAWTFGNGGSSTSSSGTYQFASPGTFTVRLNATDRNGTLVGHTWSISVQPNASVPPTKGNTTGSGSPGLPAWTWGWIAAIVVAAAVLAVVLLRRRPPPPAPAPPPPAAAPVAPAPPPKPAAWDEET